MVRKNNFAISQDFGAQRGSLCYIKITLPYHSILAPNVSYDVTQK